MESNRHALTGLRQAINLRHRNRTIVSYDESIRRLEHSIQKRTTKEMDKQNNKRGK